MWLTFKTVTVGLLSTAICSAFIPMFTLFMPATASAGGGAAVDPRSVRVPNGAINPGFANERPKVTDPENPGVWPGTAYWPRGHNDTRNQGTWKVYIKSWDSDPPNTIWFYIYNDNPSSQRLTHGDIIVTTGWNGQKGGFWKENTSTVRGLELYPGMNKVPVNIHHVKGQIIRANLRNVKPESNIKVFD